jgi:mycothiol synthase
VPVLALRPPFRARPVRPEDADALLAVAHAHQTAVLGRPDSTLTEIHDGLTDPDLDPRSIVALGADDVPVACALVYADGDSGKADLDVFFDPGAALPALPAVLEVGLALAEDGARERGAAQSVADITCYREDTHLAAALEAAGLTPATTFHRLRRDLQEAVPVSVPPGVAVERVEEDEEHLRRAHRLHQSTFAGHFGFEPRPYDDWLVALRARTGTGPLWFAVADGADVGFLHETDQFAEDEDAGYVWRLGVERSARGRGIAIALLLSAFADMRARGRRAALLHVDTANATGATRLYESVGMVPVVVMDVWRRAERLV